VLVQHDPVAPLELETEVDEHGVARKTSRLAKAKVALSRFYFADAQQSLEGATPLVGINAHL
jgi:ubiquinol-cytochrome c reductase cytochrome b subunit